MNKKESLATIVACAKLYKEHLVGRNLLIVSSGMHGIEVIEFSFYAYNFLHMLGVKTNHSSMTATRFYKKCIQSKLSESDFTLTGNGVSTLKLSILPHILKPNLSAHAVADYNHSGIHLFTG